MQLINHNASHFKTKPSKAVLHPKAANNDSYRPVPVWSRVDYLVFADVSVDHWLHLVEVCVLGARMIELSINHRSLEIRNTFEKKTSIADTPLIDFKCLLCCRKRGRTITTHYTRF